MKHLVGILLASLCVFACAEGKELDWVAVSRDTLSVGVDIEGSLAATDATSVGPPGINRVWEYKIARLAPEGEIVEEGDMLVSFDSSALREQLEGKQNERDAAKVALEKRRQEISLSNRDQALALAEAEAKVRKALLAADQPDELSASLTIRKAKLDLRAAREDVAHQESQLERRRAHNQSELATLQGRLGLAEREVEELQKNVAQMTVVATRPGTVIYGRRWGDQKFKVGDNVWRASSVLEVASLDSMMAEGTVDEADAAKLAIGQKVRLRLEVHPDSEVRGTLREIARTVQRKSRDVPTKVVAVKLSIEPVEGLQLRPGMRFRGEVETERIENAVIAPLNAVFSSGAGPVAYRLSDGEPERRSLVLGKRDSRGVQVLEGLVEGDKVSRIDLANREDH